MILAALDSPMRDSWESLLRLVLAGVAGGLVGLDRQIRGREAGFRTNILVCLGSALVMIVSTHFATMDWRSPGGFNINVDPARVAYSVMAGVGFLGAGAIIHNRGAVRGLTTAAGLWCVAAIGLAIGLGLYLVAAMATVLVVAAMWLLEYVEDLLPRHKLRTITIRVPYQPGCVEKMEARVRQIGIRVLDVTFDRRGDPSQVDIHLQIMLSRLDQIEAIEKAVEAEGVMRLIATEDL